MRSIKINFTHQIGIISYFDINSRGYLNWEDMLAKFGKCKENEQ